MNGKRCEPQQKSPVFYFHFEKIFDETGQKQFHEMKIDFRNVHYFCKTDLEALADGILEQGKKIAEDSSVLNLLTTEYEETTRAIDNLLRAVEQGIFTQSTKDRLEQLEARKTELETKIACEKARSMLVISKEQIMEHLHAALKRSPKQLISYFIRKIVLFNDHIDIYCKSIENHDPDGNDSHREFSFYEVKMTVEVDRHTFGGEAEKQTYAVVLWI